MIRTGEFAKNLFLEIPEVEDSSKNCMLYYTCTIARAMLAPLAFVESFFSAEKKENNALLSEKGHIVFSKAEQKILEDITELFSSNLGLLQKEIFAGAHVKIEDGGLHYTQWKKFEEVYERYSSHRHAKKGGSALDLPSLKGTVLFWKEDSYTHFQLERSPLRWPHIVRHFMDYLQYAAEGRQVGLTGFSVYTEDSPIRLRGSFSI